MLPNPPAHGSTIPTEAGYPVTHDSEACPEPGTPAHAKYMRDLAAKGDDDALHDAIWALNPDWSWSKARKTARRFIRRHDERAARALEYARLNATPSDRFAGRHELNGAQARDLTGNRAAHNLDTLAGGGARV